MNTPMRHLRLMQVGCILLVLACIWVSRLGKHESQGGITAVHWVVTGAALWSAVSGFTLQRKLSRTPKSQRVSNTSTPASRWKAGHVLRLASAAAVAMWALYLSELGGPPVLVNALFAIGVVLLLIWKPGAIPASTQTQPH